MSRAKNYLIVVGVLAALTVAFCLILQSALTDSVTSDVRSRLVRGQKLFGQVARLESMDFASLAVTYAQEAEFVKAMQTPDITQKRSALFVAVEARNARLGRESRKADLIAVTDSTGKVLVRDLDPNVMYGDNLAAQYPSVGIALSGTANKDIWSFRNRPMRVAAAPVRGPDGRVLGALLIGFVMTDKEARHKKELFGAEIAYVLDGKIGASSFSAGGDIDTAKEDVERARLLGAEMLQPGSATAVALGANKASEPVPVKVGGEEYLAVVQPWPGNSVNKTAAVVLLESLTQALRPVLTLRTAVLLFGVLAILAALGGMLLASRRFLGSLDQLETGTAEVINGNLDYTFSTPSPDYEGLANALNVMLARLLGRPEPGEEDDGDQVAQAAKRWRSDNMFEDVEVLAAAGGGHVADESTLKLAQEPLDAYFKRTFDEYLAAKRQAGGTTDGITLESFRAKLSQNETFLCGKYKCKAVRFRVVVKGKEVTLKPVPIY